MFGLSYLKNEGDWSNFLHINERKSYILLLQLSCCSLALSMKEQTLYRLHLLTLRAFSASEKTKEAFPRQRITFLRSSVDYKILQDFTRKQCQLKNGVQANTHTHTHRQDDCFTLASRLRVARVMKGKPISANRDQGLLYLDMYMYNDLLA